jgi:hypothetical protein
MISDEELIGRATRALNDTYYGGGGDTVTDGLIRQDVAVTISAVKSEIYLAGFDDGGRETRDAIDDTVSGMRGRIAEALGANLANPAETPMAREQAAALAGALAALDEALTAIRGL